PAAGLADEPERLAGAQRQIDAVDRVDLADAALEDAGGDREVLHKTVDPEDLAAFLCSLVDFLENRFAHLRLPPRRALRAGPCDPRALPRSGTRSDARFPESGAEAGIFRGTARGPARGSSADGTGTRAAG